MVPMQPIAALVHGAVNHGEHLLIFCNDMQSPQPGHVATPSLFKRCLSGCFQPGFSVVFSLNLKCPLCFYLSEAGDGPDCNGVDYTSPGTSDKWQEPRMEFIGKLCTNMNSLPYIEMASSLTTQLLQTGASFSLFPRKTRASVDKAPWEQPSGSTSNTSGCKGMPVKREAQQMPCLPTLVSKMEVRASCKRPQDLVDHQLLLRMRLQTRYFETNWL